MIRQKHSHAYVSTKKMSHKKCNPSETRVSFYFFSVWLCSRPIQDERRRKNDSWNIPILEIPQSFSFAKQEILLMEDIQLPVEVGSLFDYSMNFTSQAVQNFFHQPYV